jgi:hypothetical protein
MGAAMTEDIALPLPGDVDVSDMPHMPLLDPLLMKSRAWLRAKHWRGNGPGLAFVLLNLWTAAFREVPAGSLEDHDDLLADAARVDIAIWREIKAEALQGWHLHAGRWCHPKVSELAWNLWQSRLGARHENAFKSWRMQAKRASDKGVEPPPPPGDFQEWLAATYPGTCAYIAAQDAKCVPHKSDCVTHKVSTPDECVTHKAEKIAHKRPKRSEGKILSPLTPQPVAPDKPKEGREGSATGLAGAQGKAWFAGELRRLEREFFDMLPLMLTNLQRPGIGGKFALVQWFKGCWLLRGGGAGREIVLPSKQRADALWAAHGGWLKAHWPDIRVRHASVDEKREFKRRAA